MAREDVRIPSGEEELAAWLWRPGPAAPAPCVVLGHGFGALKEARLDAYAERFAAIGIAALAFDYRHFGGSGGEPRQLLDIARQHDDWRAALRFVRSLEDVDGRRVAIWGSSFGGGHVIATASRDPLVAAAVAQVPYVSGVASLRSAGLGAAARMTAAAARDLAGAARGRPPHTMAIVGPPGTLAAMSHADDEPGYGAMYPPGFEWRNEVAAGIALRLALYSPGRRAGRVRCPLLVQVAERDVVTPPRPAARAARRAPRGKLRTHPVGHFDVYVGEPFERVVTEQVDFLRRHLLAPA